jgi:hypothetical protein
MKFDFTIEEMTIEELRELTRNLMTLSEIDAKLIKNLNDSVDLLEKTVDVLEKTVDLLEKTEKPQGE